MKNFYLFVIILAILGLNSCSNRGLPIISRSSPEEKIVSQLKETKKCIKCNLENSNLNYIKLKNSDISESAFVGSSMNGVDLENSKVSEVNFENVDFSNAKLNKISGVNVSFEDSLIKNFAKNV